MSKAFQQRFMEDSSAMEEIGFIYVFALSVLLLTAVFYAIRDSTSVQKESATKVYLEDQSRLIAGIVQDVIDMRITSPEIEYRRIVDLTSPNQIYQFRMVFTTTSITLISRFQEISADAPIYNPTGIVLTPQVESDADGIMISYDPDVDMITIKPVNPSIGLV